MVDTLTPTLSQQDGALGKNVWTPRLAGGDIGLEKAETGPDGVKTVHVSIANMVVRLDLELRFYIVEPVF